MFGRFALKGSIQAPVSECSQVVRINGKSLPLFFIKNFGEICIETHLIATGILTWRLPTEHYASNAVVSRSTVARTRTSEIKEKKGPHRFSFTPAACVRTSHFTTVRETRVTNREVTLMRHTSRMKGDITPL